MPHVGWGVQRPGVGQQTELLRPGTDRRLARLRESRAHGCSNCSWAQTAGHHVEACRAHAGQDLLCKMCGRSERDGRGGQRKLKR
eukprot:661067-Prymnesium_polylepis.1